MTYRESHISADNFTTSKPLNIRFYIILGVIYLKVYIVPLSSFSSRFVSTFYRYPYCWWFSIWSREREGRVRVSRQKIPLNLCTFYLHVYFVEQLYALLRSMLWIKNWVFETYNKDLFWSSTCTCPKHTHVHPCTGGTPWRSWVSVWFDNWKFGGVTVGIRGLGLSLGWVG